MEAERNLLTKPLVRFSIDELKSLSTDIKRELDQRLGRRAPNRKVRATPLETAYSTYTRTKRLNYPLDALKVSGWSFEEFTTYISKRVDLNTVNEIPILDILEEELEYRCREWRRSRDENRQPVYIPLDTPFDFANVKDRSLKRL